MADDAQYYKDRYYPLLWALRDRPVLPPPLILHILSTAGNFSLDIDEGKRIQREYGLDAVPPVTECEIGAGFWHRIIRPVPSKQREAAPRAEQPPMRSELAQATIDAHNRAMDEAIAAERERCAKIAEADAEGHGVLCCGPYARAHALSIASLIRKD